MSTFWPGQVVTLSALFADKLGAPADPTAQTLTVQAPDGTQSTPTPVQQLDDDAEPVVGSWACDVTCTAVGRWTCDWIGTGAVATVNMSEWWIRRGLVAESV
jgi:hypothetical protein